jgi:tetratricopeptide (TPR) repeat protein
MFYLKWDPMKTLSGIALVLFLATTTNLQAAKLFCGELNPPGQYGPFDYRVADKDKLYMVESAHFTANIRNLEKGNSDHLGGELSYTLEVFPNHYPALQALVKLSLREKTTKPRSAKFPVECYFNRAIRWRSDDAIVRMLYANYLTKFKRYDDALEQYQAALRLQPENANLNYNIGLLYLKRKNYEQSVVYAKKAYGLGFPLSGLRNKLKRAGKWDGTLDESADEEKDESVDEDV